MLVPQQQVNTIQTTMKALPESQHELMDNKLWKEVIERDFYPSK